MFLILGFLISLSQAEDILHGYPSFKSTPMGGRIIGGKDAEIEDYPYQISLESHGRHMCGGSIISEEYIVTAAHCVKGANPGKLKIRSGSKFAGRDGQQNSISEIFVHPNFSTKNVSNDIAVLKLAESLKFGATVNNISLPEKGEPLREGSTSVVTGWGYTKEGGTISEQLQMVEVPIVSNEKCGEYYDGKIDETMVCAGLLEGGKDACQGDSGGPLVANGKLHGVVSWGYGCARPKYPGVYANVAHLREFVDSVINK